MDPTQCLADILGNLRSLEKTRGPGDARDEAISGLRHLADWLDSSLTPMRGGFPPDVDEALYRLGGTP